MRSFILLALVYNVSMLTSTSVLSLSCKFATCSSEPCEAFLALQFELFSLFFVFPWYFLRLDNKQHLLITYYLLGTTSWNHTSITGTWPQGAYLYLTAWIWGLEKVYELPKVIQSASCKCRLKLYNYLFIVLSSSPEFNLFQGRKSILLSPQSQCCTLPGIWWKHSCWTNNVMNK